MFEARLAYGVIWKKLLESVKDLLIYAEFECSASGIKMQAMDSSHIALVFLDLQSSGFNIYRCDRNFSMRINLNSMWKILNVVGDKDSVTLKAHDTPDTLTIICENSDQSITSHYEMRLMDLSNDALEIPETSHSCTILLPSAKFSQICRDLLKMNDDVVISCSREKELKFSVNSDIGKGHTKLLEKNCIGGEEEGVVINVRDPVSLQFSCRYLNYITKATALNSQVQLSLSPNFPLVVEYRLPDIGLIRYYLSSKIEDE